MNLFEALESFSWPIAAFIIVGILVAFTIIGTILVRKTINQQNIKNQQDVAGFVFTNLGVLYAVLLGFTVVNVQQRFDKIKETAQLEASYLSALYEAAEVFPDHNKQEIRNAIKNYGESIIEEEWELMVKGIPSERTLKALKNMWAAYYHVEPSTYQQQAWYSESIQELGKLLKTRLLRLSESDVSIGPEMWSLLIIGGITIVAFMWLFRVDDLFFHLLIGSILAASIAFLLFLIYSLDTAFSGAVSIPPDAIDKILKSFDILA